MTIPTAFSRFATVSKAQIDRTVDTAVAFVVRKSGPEAIFVSFFVHDIFVLTGGGKGDRLHSTALNCRFQGSEMLFVRHDKMR